MMRPGTAFALCVVTVLAPVGAKAYAPGPRNFWAGAQVGYNLAGNGKFEDNVRAAAQFSLQTWSPPWLPKRIRVPIMGNVARLSGTASKDENNQLLQSLVTSVEGINISLVPNYQVGDPSRYGITLWSSVGWRYNALGTSSDSVVALPQTRYSAGIEFSIGDWAPSDKPATISLEGVLATFSSSKYAEVFGSRESSIGSLEVTGIVPMYSELGLLAEFTTANHDVPDVWRLAIVFAPKPTGGKM